MSSITNINNNAYVTNIGRTTPVSPGQQPASRSIPVVLATDQTPVPVEEQNKVQSEVALSLLGIPRAEVALGIFADVNTYDVNPSEWSSAPQAYIFGHGTKHLPNEAGALVEAPRNETSVLTSKRFFRYQPGRVSAATFGIKSTVSVAEFAKNPIVRKYGIFDNLDGYYWETRQNAQEDNFSVVRRTQSLFYNPATPFGENGDTLRGNSPSNTLDITQTDDYRIVGKAPNSTKVSPNNFAKDRAAILDNKFDVVQNAYDSMVAAWAGSQTITYAAGARNSGTFTSTAGDYYEDLAESIYGSNPTQTEIDTVTAKCFRDGLLWTDRILDDLEWGGTAHVGVNITNFDVALLTNADKFEAPFYGYLSTELTGLADVVAADSKIASLVSTIQAFYNNGTKPDMSVGETDSIWGSKGKLDTIYDVKALYWGYLATEYKADGTKAEYINTEGAPVTELTDVVYSVGDRDYTLAEVKAKCQRDTGYLIYGFKNDIAGGGNAETKYNMSMYMKASGLSIASQSLVEIDRQTGTKNRILADLENTFGYTTSSATYVKQAALAQAVVDNFAEEDTSAMELGERGFAGNLIVQRDGLIMTHAAIFDPSLMKDREEILTLAEPGTNSFTLAKGNVTFGQHVKLKTGINANLEAGGVYKVLSAVGTYSQTFTLDNGSGSPITFTEGEVTAAGKIYFETVVPFIFPDAYDPAVWEAELEGDITSFPRGMMFPYMYATDQGLASAISEKVGYINTTNTDPDVIRTEIDAVNFIPEYINWIKNNVKPEYYSVYEYRVPRSRFSHDTLDGKSEAVAEANAEYTPPFRVYSDRATGEGGIKRPGDIYIEDGVAQKTISDYEFDFTKVSMLKIEFSWYGAVGALFLAYVPISSGEARWVRVHHLRASNQLKIPSLGNATLPITYKVYGGGDELSLGDGEAEGEGGAGAGIDQGYGNDSHNIVKYGASYYIDGGDRGTVRLYSHNNDEPVAAIGKQWSITGSVNTGDDNSIDISGTGVDARFFMGARLKTGSKVDQNIRVVWADSDADKVYLNATPSDTSNPILLTDRANTVYGLETKERILSTLEGNAIRNRVQVYPTKLSTSNLTSTSSVVRLRMKKTPIFQSLTQPGAGVDLAVNTTYRISSENNPLPVTETGGTYLQNGESVYGWFKGVIDESSLQTLFGRLYKSGDSYYFESLETYSGVVEIRVGYFLPDGRFTADGTTLTANSKVTVEKEGLSSVLISLDDQVPIPGTGINIATLYLQPGTEQLDLLSYFDYNKEYLSYPLTNIPDTLYLAVDQDRASSNSDDVSLGVTWEEQ